MADAPRERDGNPEGSNQTDREASASFPTWVKVSGLILGVLVLLLAAIMLIAGEEHGPGRHATRVQPTQQTEQTHPGDEAPALHDPSDWGNE